MAKENDSIGERLRGAREAAGLTIDDVHYRTRLPKAVVAALEAEDFAGFASPLYARSFLKQYSDFLKVDADAWVDALEPGSYIARDMIGTLLDAPGAEAGSAKNEAGDARFGGWLATPVFMLFSVVVVVLAMKGYEHFEAKAHSEEPSAKELVPAQPLPAAAETGGGPGDPGDPRDPSTPPPRAIIVR